MPPDHPVQLLASTATENQHRITGAGKTQVGIGLTKLVHLHWLRVGLCIFLKNRYIKDLEWEKYSGKYLLRLGLRYFKFAFM